MEGFDHQEVAEEQFAKDGWIDGWVQGNLLIPQIFPVINTFTLAAILEDENADLSHIKTTKLTNEQLKQVIKKMHFAHAGNRVKAVTERSLLETHGSPMTVENRIQSLWDDVAKLCQDVLDDFISKDTSFSATSLEDLKIVVAKIREIIRSDEFLDIAEEYKAYLKESPNRNEENDQLYRKRISNFVLHKLLEARLPMMKGAVKSLCKFFGFYVND